MSHDRETRVRSALGVLLVLAAGLLTLTPNPFTAGVARRLAEGVKPEPVDWWASYGWGVAVLATLFLAGLTASVPRWLGRAQPVERPALAPPPHTRLGVALVLGAMLVGAGLGLARLPLSLWDDEAYSVENSIVGIWRFDERDGRYAFDKVHWPDVFWGYQVPNNHVPYSALARVAIKLSEIGHRRPDRMVDESALRMPAMVAGTLAIGALAWFLWRAGFGAAGVLGAWLLALHPWALRYISEARGYSLAMLLGSVLLAGALGVLHRGSWKRWLGYASAQLVLLWVFPPTVYFVALVNLVVAALLLARRGEEDAGEQLVRFVVANLSSALLWLTFMLPNLQQLVAYLARRQPRTWITPTFVRNLFSHVLAGCDWRHGGAPLYPELSASVAAHPVLVVGWVALLLALLVAGIVRMGRSRGAVRWLLPVLVLPGPLAFLQLWIANDRTYVWYFIFFLPGLLALVALGATWPLALRERGRAGPLLGSVLCLLVLAGVFWVGAPARHALRKRSWFPLRESVQVTRPSLDPRDPRNERILTASWSGNPRYYDPRHHDVPRVEQLRALMERADATGASLFVNLGRLHLAERRSPEGMALVRNPELFELVAELPGFTPTRSRWVWRYRGRGAEVSPVRPADSVDPSRATLPGR